MYRLTGSNAREVVTADQIDGGSWTGHGERGGEARWRHGGDAQCGMEVGSAVGSDGTRCLGRLVCEGHERG